MAMNDVIAQQMCQLLKARHWSKFMKRFIVVFILFLLPYVVHASNWKELKHPIIPKSWDKGSNAKVNTYIDMDKTFNLGNGAPFGLTIKEVINIKNNKAVWYQQYNGYCPYEAQEAEATLMTQRILLNGVDKTQELKDQDKNMEETNKIDHEPINDMVLLLPLFNINELSIPSNAEIYNILCKSSFMPS